MAKILVEASRGRILAGGFFFVIIILIVIIFNLVCMRWVNCKKKSWYLFYASTWFNFKNVNKLIFTVFKFKL